MSNGSSLVTTLVQCRHNTEVMKYQRLFNTYHPYVRLDPSYLQYEAKYLTLRDNAWLLLVTLLWSSHNSLTEDPLWVYMKWPHSHICFLGIPNIPPAIAPRQRRRRGQAADRFKRSSRHLCGCCARSPENPLAERPHMFLGLLGIEE